MAYLRHIADVRLERLSKVMISLIQDNGKPGRNLNGARAGYKPKKLSIKKTSGIFVFWEIILSFSCIYSLPVGLSNLQNFDVQ